MYVGSVTKKTFGFYLLQTQAVGEAPNEASVSTHTPPLHLPYIDRDILKNFELLHPYICGNV